MRGLALTMSACVAAALFGGPAYGQLQFDAPIFTPAGVIGGPGRPLIGDVDLDGNMDVVTASAFGPIVCHGNGHGRFERIVQLSGSYRNSELADLDADGFADLIVAEYGSGFGDVGGVQVHYHDRISGFANMGTYFPAGYRSFGARAVDVDLDGILDIVVLKAGEWAEDGGSDVLGAIAVLRGLGGRSFAAAVQTSFVDANPSYPIFEIADFDSDGVPDVIAPLSRKNGADLVRVMLGNGDGTFRQGLTKGVTGVSAAWPALADFDEDGIVDVATVPGSDHVNVDFGDGAGGYRESRRTVIGPSRRCFYPFIADFDLDGRADVGCFSFVYVAGFPANHMTSVLLGDGVGSFGRRTDFASEVNFLNGEDVDGDALPDLVGLHGPSIVARLNTSASMPLYSCRTGNVNATVGPITNVLFVNGMRGVGLRRLVEVDRAALFQVRMKPSPADDALMQTSEFALFAWVGGGTEGSVTSTAYGPFGMPPEFAGGNPKRTWNNTGDPGFGSPDLPSTPAPSVVLRRERGVGKRLTFFLQGLVADPASPSGTFAVTNAIEVESR